MDRVVKATCKLPFLSPNNNINTEARCFQVAAKYYTTQSITPPGLKGRGTHSGGGLYVRNRYRQASDTAVSGRVVTLILPKDFSPGWKLTTGKRNSLEKI